jgi:hypothetical protein
MKVYRIAVPGDNEALHRKALARAVEVIEAVNKAPIYRAWIEDIPSRGATGQGASRELGENELGHHESARFGGRFSL